MPIFNNEVKLIPKDPQTVENRSVKHLAKKTSKEKEEPEEVEGPKVPYSWDTYEYIFREKTSDWYVSVGIVAAGLVVVSFIMKNFLLGVLSALGGFTLMLYGSRRPNLITVTIQGHGVQVGDRLFPYDAVKSFWIFYEPGGRKELILVTDGAINPHVRVLLGATNPAEVRSLLSKYLKEKQEEESFVDIISQVIGL